MSDQTKDLTPRAQLRAWIRDQIKGQSEVELPGLTERAVKFAIKDRGFLKALLLELLRPMVYSEARDVVSSTRTAPPSDRMVQMGDSVVSRTNLSERAVKMSRKWSDFKEHAGSRHVLLLDMTADDLALAEEERRKRGDTEYGYANLWAKLRTRLEPGQRVRDVWTPQEIEAAARALKAA